MTSSRASILLVSGAGLPAWIWDEVRSRLDPDRDTAVAARPTGSARLADYAAAAMRSAPEGPLVIVAHSVGGVIAAELLATAPTRVAGLLGVSAVVPRPGRSFIGALPAPRRWLVSAAIRVAGTRPPDAAIRAGIAAGLPEATVERLVGDFTPESRSLYTDRAGRIPSGRPRGYVFTARDREVPLGMQRASAERVGGTWRRTLPTGHLPMLEDPAGLASAIAAFAAAVPSP
ncbi:alpha/beta hydrolase [Leifsonia sp. NPDC080035]|uniref:Alpha/beta hydrolase n=1 Tax=Leifsonia sp. NPDC080035 TaxID=3143936 RepID=A0AAU7GCS4_9MICO